MEIKKKGFRKKYNSINQRGGEGSEEDSSLDMSFIFFITEIALYITTFVFLFQDKTEYLAWIFGFIVNTLFPLTWIAAFLEYPMTNYKGYLMVCIFVGLVLEFVALLITVISNSIVKGRIADKQRKKSLEKDGTGENTQIYDNLNNFFSGIIAEIVSIPYWLTDYYRNSNNISKDNNENKYRNEKLRKSNHIIKSLFITITVLVISVISNYFVDEVEVEIKNKEPPKSTLGSNIHWWLNFLPVKLEQLDNFIQGTLSLINIDPLFKFFLLFCIGFSAFFFIFVRIIPQYSNYGNSYLEDNAENLKIIACDIAYTHYIRDAKVPGIIPDEKCYWTNNKEEITLDNGKKYNYDDINPYHDTALQSDFLTRNNLRGVILKLNYDIAGFPDIYNTAWGPVDFQTLLSFFMALTMVLVIPLIWMLFNFYGFIDLLSFKTDTCYFFTETEPIFEKKNTKLGSYLFYIGSILLFLGVFFSVYNNIKISQNPTTDTEIFKRWDSILTFIFSFIFGIVGTPVVFMILEMFSRLFGKTMVLSTTWNSNSDFWWFSIRIMVIIIFIVLVFTLYGVSLNFFTPINDNPETYKDSGIGHNNNIKAFVISIISIIVGWAFAFSPYVKMFSFIYNIIHFFIKNIVFVLGPVGILALSITQLAIADKASKELGEITGP